jgi:hypothetical protein
MIRIDDSLLEEIGLMALPEEERRQLLKQIYETLEMRVGMRLAERMNDQQLDEFERFIDGDMAYVEDYLNQRKPGWQQSEQYMKEYQAAQQSAQRAGSPVNEAAVRSQFGALTWLETNFPDYKQVVATELDKLKLEIKQDSEKIMQAAQPDAVNSGQHAQAPQALPHNENVVQGAFSPQRQQSDQYDQNQQPPMAA